MCVFVCVTTEREKKPVKNANCYGDIWTEFDKERAIKAAKDLEEALLAAEPRRVKSELEKNSFFLKKKLSK